MKIVAEDKLVEERTAELLQEWERKKPIHVSKDFQKGLINTACTCTCSWKASVYSTCTYCTFEYSKVMRNQ